MRTSLRLTAASIAAAAGLAVVSPAATAAPAPNKIPGKLTVNSYTAYLKTQKIPEAKRTLAKFNKLNAKQKAQFVAYLQDRRIYLALIDQVKGTIGKPLRVVDPYNTDVKFVTEVTSQTGTDDNRTTKVTFKVTETIFSIPVTSETIGLTYTRASKKSSPRIVSGTANVTNVNGAIKIAPQGKITTKLNGAASAEISWKATGLVESFGKPVTKNQSTWGSDNGYYSAKLANR
ncbi:hypothetical protein [Streptomyces sp. SYSU K21746]